MRRSSRVEGRASVLIRLFVAVGVLVAATGLGSVPAGPAPAAWSAPLVVNPAQGGDPDPGGGSGDSSGDSSSGDAVASKPKESGSSDSGGGDKPPDVEKAPNSAPDSNSDSGSSGEQAEVAPPPPGAATQDGPTSSGAETPKTTADPGALAEPDSGASGQTQNLSPVVDRDPQSNLLADNRDPMTQDLVNKYQTPTTSDAVAPNSAAVPPAEDGTPPPVGVAPGTVPPTDPATTADGSVVRPGTAVTKAPVDEAATWKCATMGMGCDSSGVDLSTIDLEPAHQTLDTASFVPGANVPAAAVNTTMYLGEGKYGDALIAAAAIPPGGKWVTAGGKLAANGLSKGYKWFKETGVYKKGEEAAAGAWNRLTGGRTPDEPAAGPTPAQAAANPTPPPQAAPGGAPPPQNAAGPALTEPGGAAQKFQNVSRDIVDPKKFDPQSIKGMNSDDLAKSIPSNWEKLPSKSGDGTVYRDPKNLGRQIRIMPGYTAGNRPDVLSHAPYAVVSQNGQKAVKVPLEGNPAAGGGN